MYEDIANDAEHILAMQADPQFQELRRKMIELIIKYRQQQNYAWLGLPVIQHADDLVIMQEIITRVKPAVIIETGIAHGGSIIFSASILEALGHGEVVGIEIALRDVARQAILSHPLKKRITLIDGSSTSAETQKKVYDHVAGRGPVLVFLDSDHTHAHVLKELEIYSPLVKKGSYIIAGDATLEELPPEVLAGFKRPWGKGNNPQTAAKEFLKNNRRFEVDKEFENKALFTAAAGGFLKCISD